MGQAELLAQQRIDRRQHGLHDVVDHMTQADGDQHGPCRGGYAGPRKVAVSVTDSPHLNIPIFLARQGGKVNRLQPWAHCVFNPDLTAHILDAAELNR